MVSFYDSKMAQVYGRCVSKQEGKQIRRGGSLTDDRGGLVPAFSCHPAMLRRIANMGRDGLRSLFRGIGVASPYELVLFEAPSPSVGPIPQRSGGIDEYKFPSGTEVDYQGSVRL